MGPGQLQMRPASRYFSARGPAGARGVDTHRRTLSHSYSMVCTSQPRFGFTLGLRAIVFTTTAVAFATLALHLTHTPHATGQNRRVPSAWHGSSAADAARFEPFERDEPRAITLQLPFRPGSGSRFLQHGEGALLPAAPVTAPAPPLPSLPLALAR